ncbi:TolC family protein [Methylocystis heyeri]|uniref:TolC family protein n=1 Tax=Methylocystis heyeri TaxID=391905 RepID=A0A6B8KDL5_9HYPH|nr:TolC family protein [Methylocystis heyeri]QGM46346.1 TolC family protein [Methylocystis heyeri]
MSNGLMIRLLVACLLLLGSGPTDAKPKPKPKAAAGFVIARHLTSAVDIDAQSAALEAQRRAIGARYHTADSISPGSPYISSARRSNAGGNLHGERETEIEASMPVWLPGQSQALRETVDAGVVEIDERLALRRLEVAALVRDAWWRAQRAAREAAIARSRLSTARDIEADMSRRETLGESAHQDTLLAQNETLAAASEVAQAEAASKAARAAYAVLTNGVAPDGELEPVGRGVAIDDHPALRAPLAAVSRAESQLRLVDASFIENPEIGVFGRHEQNREYEFGKNPADLSRTDSTTLGFRIKIPLPTPGRNEPRRAEAEADLVKSRAEYERARRIVAAEIAAARTAVAAAQRNAAISARRLAVASEQFELERKSFQLGEANAVDLYRVRQSYLDAQRAQATGLVDLRVAQSRLNQAQGYAPD